MSIAAKTDLLSTFLLTLDILYCFYFPFNQREKHCASAIKAAHIFLEIRGGLLACPVTTTATDSLIIFYNSSLPVLDFPSVKSHSARMDSNKITRNHIFTSYNKQLEVKHSDSNCLAMIKVRCDWTNEIVAEISIFQPFILW